MSLSNCLKSLQAKGKPLFSIEERLALLSAAKQEGATEAKVVQDALDLALAEQQEISDTILEALPEVRTKQDKAREADKAKEILDAANVTGKERLDALAAVRRGDLTADEVAEAHKKPEAPVEKPVEQPARVGKEERRASPEERRKRYESMTPEELMKELEEKDRRHLTDHLTGLPNKAAYEEADKLPIQAFADIDGLKTVNDTLGHDVGNVLIKAMANALRKETDQVYRIHGDEFYVQGETVEAVQAIMNNALKTLSEQGFEYTTTTGEIITRKGMGFSYGTGQDIQSAEVQLYADKQTRKALGLRTDRADAEKVAAETAAGREAGGQEVALAEANVDTAYHYTNGNMGMKSNGSFTADKSRWITFSLDEALSLGDRKPAYATKVGIFVGTESGKRLKPAEAKPLRMIDRGLLNAERDEDIDPSTEESTKVQAGIEGKTPQQAAQFIIASGSEFQKEVAQKVLIQLNRLRLAGVKLELKIAHNEENVPGQLLLARGLTDWSFAPHNNRITVWINGTDVKGKVGTSYTTVLHELIHMATSGMIHLGQLPAASTYKTGKDVADLIAVTDHIRDHFNQRVADSKTGKVELTDFETRIHRRANNALDSTHEVLAWGLSNPEAQAYMESIPYPAHESAWTAFVSAIRRILGLSDRSETAFTEILRIADNLMNDNVNEILGLDTARGFDTAIQMPRGSGQATDKGVLFSQSSDKDTQVQPTTNPHTKESATASMLEAHTGKAKAAIQAMLDTNTLQVITAERAGQVIGEGALSSVAGYNTPDALIQELGAIHPNVDAFLSIKGDTITLSELQMPKDMRNQGLGSRFMEVLTGYADQNGMTITLHAAGDYGGSRTGQERFYKRFDFVANKGRNKDYRISENMLRRPKSNPDIRYSSDGKPLAFFNPSTNVTYIIADNIPADYTDQQWRGIILHEIGVHAKNLGKDSAEFKAILKQVDAMRKAGNRAVVEAFNAVPADTAPEHVTEEALAYTIQNHPDLSIVQKFLAWFRNAIRSIGKAFPIGKQLKWYAWANTLSQEDLTWMAQKALESARPSTMQQLRENMQKLLHNPTQEWIDRDIALNKLLGGNNETLSARIGKAKGTSLLARVLANGLDSIDPGHIERALADVRKEAEVALADMGREQDKATSEGMPLFSKQQPSADTLPEETKMEATRRIGQDAMLRFKVIQDWLAEKGVNISEAANVYQKENLSKATTANRIEDFREFESKPLIEKIADAGFKLSDIADYLEAAHIPEANERMRQIHKDPGATANGIPDSEAKAVLDKFQAMPNFAEFKSMADEVRAIGEETLDMRLMAGVITQEQYDAYKATYQLWVPLRGDMSKQGFGKGMSTNAKQKRRFGHELREEEFIIENLMKDREKAIFEIEHNNLGRAVANFLLEANDPQIGTISKPVKQSVQKDFSYAVSFGGNVIAAYETMQAAQAFVLKTVNSKNGMIQGLTLTAADFEIEKTYDPHVAMMVKPMLAENEIQFYVSGHAVRMQLNDPLLARAATNAGIERLAGMLYMARQFNNFLSKAYTAWSPDFLLVNLVRDVYQGSVFISGRRGAKFTGKVFKNYAWAWKELWIANKDTRKSQWVTRYRTAGGNTGAAYMSDIERIGRDSIAAFQEAIGAKATYDAVYAEQKAKGASDKKARTMATLKATSAGYKRVPVMGHFLRVMERLNGVFENALRLSAFRSAIESGESDQSAAQLAKDLMNFNRKGEIANQMGALYLFYNPAAQGLHVVADALLTSPHKAEARWIIGGLTMAAFLLAEMARGGDDDDERDWRNIPDYVKARNLVIKIGDYQATIPVAYGFGVFHSMGNAISDVLHGVDSNKVAIDMADSVFENFSVFGNPLVEQNGKVEFHPEQLTPTAVKMVTAPAANLDGLGRRISPIKYRESMPDSENMTRSMRGSWYAEVAATMNGLTGGNVHEPGMVDVSPNVLQYWVRSLTGGAGRFVGDAADALTGGAQGVAPELERTPVVRKFIRRSDVADSRSAFWDVAQKAKVAAEQYRDAVRDGDRGAAQDMRRENEALINFAKRAGRTGNLAGAKRNAIEKIKNSDLPATEKKLRIRQIENEEQRIYDKFLAAFDEKQQRQSK